ncbi:renalase-like isoform X2 [Neocloeon triangulifer]|uniref:renalase-like isoform X2 n=1 Tax=Neocloeon triangulifer TaxID=2078957 RepID=UPI00286F77F0|nr:renalase-like isoform X2 [Neocloeon triangulifer]
MSLKVLLVGGGLTSALISSLLKKVPVACQVWDKARGAGGRMSTTRSPTNSNCTADLGAQYITATPTYQSKHHDFYNSLLSSKVLENMTCKVEGLKDFPEGTKHYVAPAGTNAIVKHFFAEGGHQLHFEQHVSAIDLQPDNKWLVRTKSGREEVFDAIILTMPVPQIFQLEGDVQDLLNKNSELTKNLKSVKYSSRYALGLFFDNNTALRNIDWDSKYLSDHGVFRFVSLDSRKRQLDQPVAAVFHTSITFGEENIDKNGDEVKIQLLSEVKKLFPQWPEPKSVKCQKWRYSQVLEAYPETPGYVFISKSPPLLAAGDGFVHSNLDGCISSSLKTAEALKEILVQKTD